MKRMKTFLALGAFFVVAVALSGCGSGIPGNAVADMAGNPISTTAFKHWMYIAAKGSSAQTPGAPVIVPSDPPNFDTCISQVKAQIPTFAKGKTDAQIRTACKQLFTSLSGQVMDFLIRAYWYQAQAKKLGITVSDADVNKAFAAAKKQQFPTAAAFNTFLSQSGQTLNDIMFRVRVNEIYKKLLAKHQSTVSAAAIQTYYNSHTSQFGKPETRNIRIVRTNTLKAANAAKAALDARPELGRGDQEVLDRQLDQEQGRRDHRSQEGPGGAGSRHRSVRRQAQQRSSARSTASSATTWCR